MAWPWAFVSLDAAQIAHRRELLDRYANLAQLSAIVPILVIQIIVLVQWVHQRSITRSALETPGSPAVKHAGNGGHMTRLAACLRKWLWWCGGDVKLAGMMLGTKGEVLGGTAWAGWLLILVVVQTDDDYLHLTKRFGIIAASQLPLQYLLAVKTPYSPLQSLTRASHETLNAVHQILGRIITSFLYAHAILYLNFYVRSNLLLAKLQEAYVVCGIVGFFIVALIGMSSLAMVRNWSYRVFLGLHILLSTVLLPILFFHVHHIRIYLYESVAVLAINLILRALATQRYSNASLHTSSESRLVKISIPLTANARAIAWQAGQHAYVSLPGHGIKAALAKNPFTLASLPGVDHELRFVARIRSGTTADLAAKARLGPKAVHDVLVEGPYGLPTHADSLLPYDRVLLIAGGVGGTFIMPLYKQLLSDLSPSKGSYRRQKITAVWMVRQSSDIAWAIPQKSSEQDAFFERLRVYITQDIDNAGGMAQQNIGRSAHTEKSSVAIDDEEGVELEERTNLLKTDHAADGTSDQSKLPLSAGRPDVSRLVDEAFAGGVRERVAIAVCGPISLGDAVRAEAERWVYKGRDVWFWNESFAL